MQFTKTHIFFFTQTNWDHIYSKFYSKFSFAGFADLPSAKGRYFAGAGGKRNYRQNGMYTRNNVPPWPQARMSCFHLRTGFNYSGTTWIKQHYIQQQLILFFYFFYRHYHFFLRSFKFIANCSIYQTGTLYIHMNMMFHVMYTYILPSFLLGT